MTKKLKQKQAINWYQAMGVNDLIVDEQSIEHGEAIIDESKVSAHIATSPQISASQNKQEPISEGDKSASRVLADKVQSLDELRAAVEAFDGCELKQFANSTVFADGNPNAKVMLIGEAPGAKEDEEGVPFCGESGKLLDAMMAAINLNRQDGLYITNTVFWRPPANRTPTKQEVEICKPFLEKHIALIKPKLVILVGSTALSSLLGPKLKVSEIKQEYYGYRNCYLDKEIKLTAIFHPAYLLRQPSQKKTTWYDLLKIQEFLIA